MSRRDSDDIDHFDDDRFIESGSAWGRPGGDWAGMRPVLDNPLTWSLPILRISGVTVRMHLLFLAFIIIQLSWAIVPSQQSPVDFRLTAIAMAVLVIIILVHEFGHVLLCRLCDGNADEVLMWPLGGLAFCHPPNNPKAHFWTALGGPLVNIAIILLASPILFLLTRDWNVVFPHPLNPLAYASDPLIGRSMSALILYMANALSVMVLAFNLLPMFPLDGGRLLQAILWKRRSWSASMRTAVRVGFVIGLALAAYGAISFAWQAVAVAVFGLIACYQTDRQLAFSDSLLDFESDEYAINQASGSESSINDDDDDSDDSVIHVHSKIEVPSQTAGRTKSDHNPKAPQPAQHDEVDRILQKIASDGIDSLTAGERAFLAEETERKRRGDETPKR